MPRSWFAIWFANASPVDAGLAYKPDQYCIGPKAETVNGGQEHHYRLTDGGPANR
jgi:hypothetical protein